MKGHLLIAGGNVKTSSIYKEFIKYAGDGKIIIIPTASSDANKTISNFTSIFEKFGLKRDRIVGIKLDPDKSGCTQYAITGDDYQSLEFMNDITGIWFTGGDQIRIIRALLRQDGYETKLLTRIKEILNSGGVVAGSSAGAAIMSEVMIGGGTSYGAIKSPPCYDYLKYRKYPQLEDEGILLITKGLGFFKEGIVDQHFEERHRIIRLLRTMAEKNLHMGYGISEDTALVYDMSNKCAAPLGSGAVTVLNTSGSIINKIENKISISKVRISYLKENDIYNINEDKFYIGKANKVINRDNYRFKNCNLYEDMGCKIKLYCDEDSIITDKDSFVKALMDFSFIENSG